ncbi:hypothetical protein QTP88_024055 [Uroleucon formosanum]
MVLLVYGFGCCYNTLRNLGEAIVFARWLVINDVTTVVWELFVFFGISSEQLLSIIHLRF